MTIEICVVGLQQQLPDSRTRAELQASSAVAANVLKLTGEVRPADQFDQVPKPVVEPGEIGRHSIAQERSFEARFPASRSLGQQIRITKEKRVGTEVFGKARLLDTRPCVPKETRHLIRTMSRENPLWGAPRIHGELMKLGIKISQASVAKYMVRHSKPPSQTWRA